MSNGNFLFNFLQKQEPSVKDSGSYTVGADGGILIFLSKQEAG